MLNRTRVKAKGPPRKEGVMNEVLKAIQDRRTIRRFRADPVGEESLRLILEAGRWAPSFSNMQPWKFLVVREEKLRTALDRTARESVLHWGIHQAPVVILVCVDRRIDPLHAIEAGAAAAQNMALAAFSLGLGSGWIGIMGTDAEAAIQKLFRLPETLRIISLLPVGVPEETPTMSRKPLEELVEFV